MNTRKVEMVAVPPAPHFVGDGFRVHNFIPSYPRLDMQRMDPFIMLDYNAPYTFDGTDTPRGVGVHPHRGFETVTIAYQGRVEHADSSGGGGVISEGDVQWMTAARGVLHKEFHEKEWSKEGGVFQMVQLWVNLPAEYKMSEPKYQAIRNADMAKVELPNGGGKIEVIAGAYGGVEGSASTYSPLHLLNARLTQGSTARMTLPADFNTALLVIDGNITVNQDEKIPANHLALMANDGGEIFEITADDDAVVLIMSGQPLSEPIAAHGPFVMNTREEIAEAFHDFNTGKFGYLED